MSQQIFADYLGIGAATLSSIYNGRTRPTLNIVESIKRKLPAINVEWLLFGTGKMFSDSSSGTQAVPVADSPRGVESVSQNAPQAAMGDLFGGIGADGMAFGGADDSMISFDAPSEGAAAPPQRPAGGVKASQRPPSGVGQPASSSGRMAVQQRPAAPERVVRHVTEIRVYYDDQTWESFTPNSSK